MRKPRAASIIGMRGGTLAAAMVFIGAMQAHAATEADAVCDRTDDAAGLHIPVNQLVLDVADHNIPEDQSADKASSPVHTAPISPLAELKPSGLTEKGAALAETDDPQVIPVGDDMLGPGSRFPGVSDDDALRYRRQMYRTDI